MNQTVERLAAGLFVGPQDGGRVNGGADDVNPLPRIRVRAGRRRPREEFAAVLGEPEARANKDCEATEPSATSAVGRIARSSPVSQGRQAAMWRAVGVACSRRDVDSAAFQRKCFTAFVR